MRDRKARDRIRTRGWLLLGLTGEELDESVQSSDWLRVYLALHSAASAAVGDKLVPEVKKESLHVIGPFCNQGSY